MSATNKKPKLTEPQFALLRTDLNTPLRNHIALMMLRAWGMKENYDGRVIATIRRWVDGGKAGPIPWPGGAFFEEWAQENGLANVDGYVGFRFTMKLVNAPASANAEGAGHG